MQRPAQAQTEGGEREGGREMHAQTHRHTHRHAHVKRNAGKVLSGSRSKHKHAQVLLVRTYFIQNSGRTGKCVWALGYQERKRLPVPIAQIISVLDSVFRNKLAVWDAMCREFKLHFV